MAKKGHDGLRKRCRCGPTKWVRCTHPWYFMWKRRGKEFRESLHRRAGVPASYVMSKTEADGWRDKLRDQIREGTYVAIGADDPATIAQSTVNDVLDRYLTDHVNRPGRRRGSISNMESHVGLLRTTPIVIGKRRVPFGALPIRDVTTDHVEALRAARRQTMQDALAQLEKARADTTGKVMPPRVRPFEKGGEAGINRLLARLRHVFSYAIRKGIVDGTPFKRHGTTMIQLATEFENGRTRRLAPGEEARLLANAGPHMYALIVAALETRCRVGELLGLRWSDVLWTDEREPKLRKFILSADRTKTARTRTIPITSRLRAVMEMRRTDPKGENHAPTAHVFGNEFGEQVKRTVRAWQATCRRAGIAGLHFHDLRREFASRLLESGASLADVQHTLGHANITMTQRYLGVTDAGLQRAFDRFEQARTQTGADVTDNDGRGTNGAQTPGTPADTHLIQPSAPSANLLN
jgi:integrase